MTKSEKELTIENWILIGETSPDNPAFFIPTLYGTIKGKKVKTSVIYWLDVEDKIAMTEKKIYKLGNPRPDWLQQLHSQGNKLSDVNVKGVVH